MIDSTPEIEIPQKSVEAGTPEAALLIEDWWQRFGPAKGKLDVFDREVNEQLDALEAVPQELEDYYEGTFRRHLENAQDLMTNNGIDIVAKGKYAQEDAFARAMIEINGYTDQLTGLKNRKWLMETIDSQLDKAHKDPNSNIYALFIDLDKFKQINTIFDHTGGDKLLTLMGQLARKGEPIARYGGEEFVQLIDLNDVRFDNMPEATDEEKIGAITNRYSQLYKELSTQTLTQMKPKDTLQDNEIPEEGIPEVVTLSFGATKLLPGESGEQLLSRASTAVTEAKKAGRDQAFIAVPEDNQFAFRSLQKAA